jgi:hypothetical protein
MNRSGPEVPKVCGSPSICASATNGTHAIRPAWFSLTTTWVSVRRRRRASSWSEDSNGTVHALIGPSSKLTGRKLKASRVPVAARGPGASCAEGLLVFNNGVGLFAEKLGQAAQFRQQLMSVAASSGLPQHRDTRQERCTQRTPRTPQRFCRTRAKDLILRKSYR